MAETTTEIKSTVSTFIAAFISVLKDQFSNQAVAGSLALGGAALLTSIGWKAIYYVKNEIIKALFTIYIIPKHSVQYQYLLSWLKKQPKSSTNVMEVLLGGVYNPGMPFGGGGFGGGFGGVPLGMPQKTSQQNENEKDEKEDLAIVPGLGASLFLQYSGSYLWISTGASSVSDYEEYPFGRRSGEQNNQKTVQSFPSITTFGPKNDLIRKILREGRKIEQENSNKFTTIYATSVDYSYGAGLNWRVVAHRPARKLESIILPGNQAQQLSADCKEFIQSEQWYTDRGIPYRRGYLLHGKPGCGKTSLVTAIAGSLKLNVYILSLASPGLNDTNLLELLNSIPPHTILLMEDIDTVFKTALTDSKVETNDEANNNNNNNNNSSKQTESASETDEQPMNMGGFGFGGGAGGNRFGGPGGFQGGFPGGNNRTMQNQTTRLTFAGILNALDGIAAQTGRLLFMTTNHKERLDPALIRPGRIDYQLQFEEATQQQVRLLFINFYRSIILVNDGVEEDDVVSAKYQTAIEKVEKYASEFANKIPDREYTMSQIQGIFMMHRQDPRAVVDTVENELLNLDTNMDVMPPIPSLSSQISSSIQITPQLNFTNSTSSVSNPPPLPASANQIRFGG